MADEAHVILQELKRVASELGRAPTREEFREKGQISDRQLRRVFGGFTAALHAAGLQSAVERPKRLKPQEALRAPLEDTLSLRPPSLLTPLPTYRKTAFAGDLHFPFACVDAISAFYQFLTEYKPDRVVQLGDLFDMMAHSRFPRSLNAYSPDEEFSLGRRMAEGFWETVGKIVPEAERVQLLGNHDMRPMLRVYEALPAQEGWVRKAFQDAFTFPGVRTVYDARQEVFFEDYFAIHGYKSKLGEHRDHALMNVVCAHTHTGGVAYRQIRGKSLWELNAGYLGDPESKALGYTPQKLSKWTKGWAAVDAWGPRFIAL